MEDRSRWNTQAAQKRRSKAKKEIPELKWDDDARKEYLTGFHKRKLQRQKKAQEFRKEQEREEKREERRMKREAAREMMKTLPGYNELLLEDAGLAVEKTEPKETKTYATYKTVTTVQTLEEADPVHMLQQVQQLVDQQQQLKSQTESQVQKRKQTTPSGFAKKPKKKAFRYERQFMGKSTKESALRGGRGGVSHASTTTLAAPASAGKNSRKRKSK